MSVSWLVGWFVGAAVLVLDADEAVVGGVLGGPSGGEVHWHGAAPDRFMAHVAMQEADDQGQVVTWLEHVSDQEYASI